MHCTGSIMITTHQMDVLAMHGASTEVKLKKLKMCYIKPHVPQFNLYPCT